MNEQFANKAKRIFSVLLVMTFITAAVPCTPTVNVLGDIALTAHATGDIVTSGTCGKGDNSDSVTWSLDSNGTLTISGTGEMADYERNTSLPWFLSSDSLDNIKSVVIENGVTSIGNCSFYQHENLSSVTISDTVTTIGEDAFSSCNSLKFVKIPESVAEINDRAFYSCAGLQNVLVNAETPPTLSEDSVFDNTPDNMKILISAGSLDSYKTQWRSYADKIERANLSFSYHGTVKKGTVTADIDMPSKGDTITLTAVPKNGYKLQTITVTDENNDPVTVTNNQFTMPAGKVVVTTTFVPDSVHFSCNSDGSYTIKTVTGWNIFCDCLQDNDIYDRFSGKTVKLAANIGTAENPVTRMAGSSNHDFCGTFDGKNKTLYINIDSNSIDDKDTVKYYVAPFRYVTSKNNVAVAIQNLKVEGTINTSVKDAGGIVGSMWGTVNIKNCSSNVTINSSVTGEEANGGIDGTHGGIVGVVQSNASLTIEGCVVKGKMLTTNNTIKCGGFVGWNQGTANIINSLYAPAAADAGETAVGTNYSATFARNRCNITNCYYTQELNDGQNFINQGKKACAVNVGSNVIIDSTPTNIYSTSGIASYTQGIKYNNVFYAGEGDTVTLSAVSIPTGYELKGYTATSGDINGNILTMSANDDVTVNATLDVPSYFDAATGTLTLKGNLIKRYPGDYNMKFPSNLSQRGLVKKIVVDPDGAVFPEDSSFLFAYFTEVKEIDLRGANTSNVTNMNQMFMCCRALQSVNVSSLDTSNVTDMSLMFCENHALQSPDLSSFDTSKVTNMEHMFSNDWAIKTLDVSSFDTSNVTNMNNMFKGCSELESLDVSSFDISKVTNTESMFRSCTKLASIYAGENWNMNNAASNNMFVYCSSLTGGAGTKYNAEHTDGTYARIDGGTDNPGYFTGKYRTLTINADGVTADKTGTVMVGETITLAVPSPQPGYVNVITVNGKIITPDENGIYSFAMPNCDAEVDLSVTLATSFDSQTGTLTLNDTLVKSGVSVKLPDGVNKSDVRHIVVGDNGAVFPQNSAHLFMGFSNLESVDLTGADISNVTYTTRMFWGCSKLAVIYVNKNWDISGVTSSEKMFNNCTSLKGEAGTTYDAEHQDASYAVIDTENGAKGYLSTRKYIVNISDTPNGKVTVNNSTNHAGDIVTLDITADTDYELKSITVVDEQNNTVSIENNQFTMPKGNVTITAKFDIESYYDAQTKTLTLKGNVLKENSSSNSTILLPAGVNKTNVQTIVVDDTAGAVLPQNSSYLFYGFTGVKSINLTNADTSKVTEMSYMFYNCSALTSLNLNTFDTRNVTTMYRMFAECAALTSLNLSSFDTRNVKNMEYMFYNCAALTSLNLSSFDTSNVTDMSYMFDNCKALQSLDLSSFDTSNVTDMSYMFDNCKALQSLDLSSSFDTSHVKTMKRMFYACSALQSLDLSSFDTGNVTDMSYMFNTCKALTSLGLSSFDTRNVTNMSYMFDTCKALTSLGLSNFDTRNVTNMSYMFRNCSALTSLNLSGFDTSNVNNMSNMFSGCKLLTSLNLSNFDTSKVTRMLSMFNTCSELTTIYVSSKWNTDKVTSSSNMFQNCSKLEGGNGTELNESVDKTFAVIDTEVQNGYLTGLYSLTLSEKLEIFTDATDKKIGDKYLKGAELQLKVKDGCTVTFVKANGAVLSETNGIYPLTFGDADKTIYTTNAENQYNVYTDAATEHGTVTADKTENVTEGTTVTLSFSMDTGYEAKEVFLNGTKIIPDNNGIYSFVMPSSDAYITAKFGIGSYYDADTKTLILKGNLLKSGSSISSSILLPDGATKTNVEKIIVDLAGATLPENSSSLFFGFTQVTEIDLTRANTSNVTNMFHMFQNCKLLSSLKLSRFDTGNVTTMASMFYNCSALTSLDLSGFDTSNVTTMANMFYNCPALTSLDLSSFDTSNVTTMSSMFYNCSVLRSLDLSSFDTGKVTNMSNMFYEARFLERAYAGKNWNTDAVTTSSNMFYNCISLSGGAGTIYDEDYPQDATYARIDGGTDNLGYFTAKYASLTINSTANGSVSADKTANILVGDTVTLTLQATAGYQLKSLTVKNENNRNITVTDNRFTMPAGNVTVCAEFEMIKTDISSAVIALSADSFDYDGTEKSVNYSVTVGDTELTKDTDFTFEGDLTATDAGVYIVKVKGINAYEGEAKTTWKIVPVEVTVKINGTPITQPYYYNKSLTVTAPAAESGKKFSHWTVNGKAVSYSATYSFIVKESVDLIPVYVADETTVEQQAVLNVKTSKTKYNGKNAIKYTFTHSVPEGYTVSEVGLMYATNKLAGANTSVSGYATMNLTDAEAAAALGVTDVESAIKNNTSGKVKKYVASYKKNNGTVAFSYALGTNTTAYTYAIGYIKVVNKATGESETLYSNFVATNYNNA